MGLFGVNLGVYGGVGADLGGYGELEGNQE